MLKTYIAIDLKSFYASVECVDRGLDPLTTNLVVADESKTEKTICLAVTPSLKAFGIPGRARLFEVIQRLNQVNLKRKYALPSKRFVGKSFSADELNSNPSLEIDFITTPPRMARYMEVSTDIYNIYLDYVAPEDIHVYSIDEVFIDVSSYLPTYKCSAYELTMRIIRDVLSKTGITATAGIGTNLYLAKVAMDIVAKKMPPDKDGVRIAQLDERSYRLQLWEHTPITDFWRVGRGIARKLEANRMFTMGDVAERSEYDEDKLYRLFGVNAELLIDHAWGWEPCTITDIKSYKPQNHSISQGQVLSQPYDFNRAMLIVREMTELLVLDLVDKGIVTNQLILTVGYDHTGVPADYQGDFEIDHHGRKLPKSAHGSVNLDGYTSSTQKIVNAMIGLFKDIVDESLQVRRMYVVANHIIYEKDMPEDQPLQLDLFSDADELCRRQEAEAEYEKREKALQHTMLDLKKKFGKNAVLKGMNLSEGATTIERNKQVGGHKA